VMRTARVFPWPLQPLSSVLYGCMFLGFAANYSYAALWGRMADAKVSLLGFFVYDVVLIVPFIRHFAVVADDSASVSPSTPPTSCSAPPSRFIASQPIGGTRPSRLVPHFDPPH
jgi:hypothetical protein